VLVGQPLRLVVEAEWFEARRAVGGDVDGPAGAGGFPCDRDDAAPRRARCGAQPVFDVRVGQPRVGQLAVAAPLQGVVVPGGGERLGDVGLGAGAVVAVVGGAQAEVLEGGLQVGEGLVDVDGELGGEVGGGGFQDEGA